MQEMESLTSWHLNGS
jgi:hypothetical protein